MRIERAGDFVPMNLPELEKNVIFVGGGNNARWTIIFNQGQKGGTILPKVGQLLKSRFIRQAFLKVAYGWNFHRMDFLRAAFCSS
jgi:hypothetical protein